MKFRRKSADAEPATDPATDPANDPTTDPAPDLKDDPDAGPGGGPAGPLDIDEATDDGLARADLGSLLIPAVEGLELRLQVEEGTEEVQAVMLAGAEGAIELRAFAAPRHGDLWSEVRPRIAADFAQRGGTASERDGRFGTELACQLSVRMPDGGAGTQASRIIGVNGPRWMLRATLLGRPALEPETAGPWEDVIERVVVRRGAHAMPVGEALALTLPRNVVGADTDDDGGPDGSDV